MKKFKCTVSFQKCAKLPDFSTEIGATSEQFAKENALSYARQCGYTGAVKKITAREMSQSD